MLVYLSLGSNMNDRRCSLTTAVQLLADLPHTRILEQSPIYETSPVGTVPQDDFYNLVVRLETLLSPHELLKQIHHIEHSLHRVRTIHWGPRTIDIDILYYGNQVINDENLVIPHPEMYRRKFVLQPLLDVYVGNRSAPLRSALHQLGNEQTIRLVQEE